MCYLFFCYSYIIYMSSDILKKNISSKLVGYNYQDVAVKILIEQDFHPDRVKEFMREVLLMGS